MMPLAAGSELRDELLSLVQLAVEPVPLFGRALRERLARVAGVQLADGGHALPLLGPELPYGRRPLRIAAFCLPSRPRESHLVRPSTHPAGRDSAGSPPPRNGGDVMPTRPPSPRPAPGARHGQSLRGRVAGGGSRTTSGSISAHGSSPVSFGGSMHRSTSLNRRWQQANRDKARAQDRRDRERKRQDPDYWVRRRGRDRLYRARKRARLSNTPPEANDG